MRAMRDSTRALWRLAIFGLGLAAAAVLLAACFDGGDGDDEGPGISITPGPTATPTETVVDTPEDAIRRFLAERDEEYAGDCEDARPEVDVGKTCTAFLTAREGQRAYVAGPTFSEFSVWLFVEKSDDRWSVVASQPAHEAAADVPGVPWPLNVGDSVAVTGTGDCLNVREGPGLEAPAVDCLPDGTEAVLAQGPIEQDGYLWWRLEGRAGWVASDWLRVPEEGQ